jgi:hypothetical protein
MDETIDKKVEGVQSARKSGFWKNAMIFAAVIGIGHGVLETGMNIWYKHQGYKYVMLTDEEHKLLSECVGDYAQARHEYLCDQAKYIRENVIPTIDKNGDGYITREEAGLPPKPR